MRADPHQEDADARCARVAARQHGAIHRRQAIAAGLSASAIQRRCARGIWAAELPATYVFASSPKTWLRSVTATALWAGDDAAIGYFTAAAVLGLLDPRPRAIDVVAIRRLRAPRPDIVVHRTTSLAPCDLTVAQGVRTTTGTRTILDLASALEGERLEAILDDALRRRATSLPRLRWILEREATKGRKGAAPLRRLLAERGPTLAESMLETHFSRLVRRYKLPLPAAQHEIRVRGRRVARVDFAYPSRKIAIEVDGYRYHSGRAAWARDAARANRLVQLGWRILRFTWDDVRRRPEAVADVVTRALSGVLGANEPA